MTKTKVRGNPIQFFAKIVNPTKTITNLALLLIVVTACWTIGLRAYLLIQLPVLLVGGGVGLWLFYVQHQFQEAYWVRREQWDPVRMALQGSSHFKLPRVLQWFTGNIGLHHIHHIQPGIPNYNLQRCHDEIPALRADTTMSLRTSLRVLWLCLYDEKSRRLVSFRSFFRRTCAGAGLTTKA